MRNITQREPREYELLTVLHPEVPEDEIPAALDRIAEYVTTVSGTVTGTLRDSPWGRRRLAYPIRHGGRDVRDGYYTVFHFSLVPHRVIEMEQELKLNTQVIRYLVTSFTPVPIDPRAVEAAEFAAEDAAAAAYAAAQAEATRLARESRNAAPPRPAPAPVVASVEPDESHGSDESGRSESATESDVESVPEPVSVVDGESTPESEPADAPEPAEVTSDSPEPDAAPLAESAPAAEEN